MVAVLFRENTVLCRQNTGLPLTEEIRLQIFGSPDFFFPDLSVLLIDHLSDGDSVYSGETSFRFFGESRENMVDMYGDSRENSLEIFAVVIILSTISSVRGSSVHRTLGSVDLV